MNSVASDIDDSLTGISETTEGSSMINPMDLSGRTILVTGASSGIGQATAVLAGQLGAKVVLVARSADKLRETAGLMPDGSGIVEPYDLQQLDGVSTWMKSLVEKTGPLHGLVHSAGMHIVRPLRMLKDEQVDDVMRLNFHAALALTRGLRQKGVWESPASVVYLSSVVGQRGRAGISPYAASKGALIALSMSLAAELADDGIRVNCVCPGHVATEMAKEAESRLTEEQARALLAGHLLGVGEPLDVANSICFLLSNAAKWITGTNLVVDGGHLAN